MPRSPLTEQYQRVMSLVEQLHALEPDERNFILDLLVPEPEPAKKPQKKSSKKTGGKGGGGSRRERSLRQQIGSVVQGSGNNLQSPQPRCIAMIDDNGGEMECGESIDHNTHHKQTDPNYHQFVAPPATHAASGD